jgi:hypothetical protein
MITTLLVELIRGGGPAWPRIEDDTHWMTVGSSRPMEDAWRIGNAELVHWIGQAATFAAVSTWLPLVSGTSNAHRPSWRATSSTVTRRALTSSTN